MPGTSHMMQEASTYWRKKYGPVTWESFLQITENTSFDSTQDGDMIIKRLAGLTVDEGAALTTSNRCKGMALFVNGNLTINGKISMTARGANASGENLAIDLQEKDIIIDPSNPENYNYTISAVGGGSTSRRTCIGSPTHISGYTGNVGINGASGGGGSGAAYSTYNNRAYSGSGGAGTSYSGGAGGGGCATYNATLYGYNGSDSGGAGGNGRENGTATATRCACGGAGNPGGYFVRSNSTHEHYGTGGQNGTGGLLILVVYGNLIIGSNGIIEANGMEGGHYIQGSHITGGGGSGGGSVNVLYTGSLTNNGTIQANGGAGGYAPRGSGGAGGAGTVRVEQFTI